MMLDRVSILLKKVLQQPRTGPAAWHRPLLTSPQNEEDHGDLQRAWEVLELPNLKRVLEVEVPAATKVKMPATATQVKVLPKTEVKVKVPAAVKVTVPAATTIEVKALLPPRSRSCYCLHH